MTARNMTPKGFLHKAGTKAAASAAAFLATHRAWLQTGELALFTTPILLKVDTRELLPTPALEEIKSVVLAHHLAEQVRIEQAKMEAASEPTERKSKSYVATVYNSKGEVVQAPDASGKIKDLTSGFDSSTKAEGWADRRLFDGAPDWFCVVESTKLFRSDGTAFTATILRGDAIARILKTKKGPVLKAQKKSGGRLSFGVKAHQTKAAFSHG